MKVPRPGDGDGPNEKQIEDSSTLLELRFHDFEVGKSEEHTYARSSARAKPQRPDSKWALRSKTMAVVVLSIVLVVAVLISKLHLMKSLSLPIPVGFQPSDPTRSTMDIVFSCVSTTIICTISVMHFNISTRATHRLSFTEKLRSKDFWDEMGRKVAYWLLGLLMPELLVMMSCGEYYDALSDCIFMQSKVQGWTLKHSFFALMKGFTNENEEVIRSGRDLFRDGAILDESSCKMYYYEICDKSKADILTKLIAIIQISRFLLEAIARAANGLPISPLEYFTCAQVFCALFTYIYWLDKPIGVQERIRVKFGEQRIGVGERRFDRSRLFRNVAVGGYSALLIAASTLISWDIPFPNPAVRTLWKVTVIVVAVCPVLAMFSFWLEAVTNRKDYSALFRVFVFLLFLIHSLFRVVLIALIFESFHNLPAEIYDTQSWLNFLPFFH